jgi:F0F1-type ATP synthase membrane subunit c/vacuolar-type H+-ATPase subunit K
MAGIIAIYGLVVSVLVSSGLKQQLPLYTGFIQLGAGLSVGLAGLAAGKNSQSWLVLLVADVNTQVLLSVSSVTLVSVGLPSSRDCSLA